MFQLWSCLHCVWEHASSSALVTLSSLPPWVGCDPASLQPPQATNSHHGTLVIPGMYFTTLCAPCPFLKFSVNPTGQRSAYQTEAADKNSYWYIGHLKMPAPVHSHLENTLFCWQPRGNFWHFVLMSLKTGVRGCFVHRKGVLMMWMSFSSYVTSYCWENVRMQEKECVDIRFSGPLRGPMHWQIERSVLISTM